MRSTDAVTSNSPIEENSTEDKSHHLHDYMMAKALTYGHYIVKTTVLLKAIGEYRKWLAKIIER